MKNTYKLYKQVLYAYITVAKIIKKSEHNAKVGQSVRLILLFECSHVHFLSLECKSL